MRLIAHLSDLHFGRIDDALPTALIAELNRAEPQLVVVSGDLTQRARAREFEAARDFLDRLPRPQIVVPGNHDVPLFDVLGRWLTPLAGYRRFITDDLEPFFADDEIAVLGLNTARSNTLKSGRVNAAQVERAMRRLEAGGALVTRIIVTHHPFDGARSGEAASVIGRAEMAMAAFARGRVDIILSGHLHRSEVADSLADYERHGRSVLLVRAGTALSTRRRGEVNAFNLVRVSGAHTQVDTLAFDPATSAFRIAASREFLRIGEGWRALAHRQPGALP